MSRLWSIALHHFRQETGKRSFLIVLLSLPLFLALTIGLGFLFANLERGHTTLGYVDPDQFLDQPLAGSEEARVTLLAYDSAQEARAALESGQIDAYYLLPAGYPSSREAELVYREQPRYEALRTFQDAVRRELVEGIEPEVAHRVLAGPDVSVRALEANREFPAGGPGVGLFVPLAVAAVFVFLVLTTSGYLMQVIVVEKENRTIEVILSSVSTGTLLAGKIAGTLGLALVQLTVWLLFLVAAAWLGGALLGIEWLQGVQLHWGDLARVFFVAVPAYFCIGALMTLVGTSLVDSQEAQQAGALFFMPMFLPLYFAVFLLQNPDGALAVGLSLFPLTSVMAMALRSLFIQIPAWQVIASAGIALTLGVVFVWLTGKAVRLNMLRYGQRLRLRELLSGSESQGGKGSPAVEVGP